jgi:hypothetical protein
MTAGDSFITLNPGSGGSELAVYQDSNGYIWPKVIMGLEGGLTVGSANPLPVVQTGSLPAGTNVIGGVTQSGTWTVAATQSGTWTVNLSGSTTVTGNVASGTTDSGNPISVAGVYNATAPTFTSGDRAVLQTDINGNLLVNDVNGFSPGTAGTPSTNVISVQGIAGMTPLDPCVTPYKYISSGSTLSAPTQQAATTAVAGGSLASGTYYYKITTLNAAGETVGSNEVSIGTANVAAPVASTPTTAITGGSLASGTYYYKVTALGSSGETVGSNEVSITTANLSAPVVSTPTTATTGGSLAAATYYYKVTALGSTGETVGSNEVSITTTGSTSTNTITWAAVTGATGYNVYRGTSAGGESTYYAAGNVTTFNDTGAAGTAGTVPTSNTAVTTTNENIITWAASAGATGYKVYRGTAAGSESTYYSPGNVTTFTDTGATGTAGTVPASNTAVTTTNENVLTWTAVPSASGYKVYRGASAGGESTFYTVSATSTTFTDTGAAGTAGTVPTSNTATSLDSNSITTATGYFKLVQSFNSSSSAIVYLKIYDKATAPIVGTDTPILTVGISTGSATIIGDAPIKVTNGLAFALTEGIADSDATPVSANQVVVNFAHS